MKKLLLLIPVMFLLVALAVSAATNTRLGFCDFSKNCINNSGDGGILTLYNNATNEECTRDATKEILTCVSLNSAGSPLVNISIPGGFPTDENFTIEVDYNSSGIDADTSAFLELMDDCEFDNNQGNALYTPSSASGQSFGRSAPSRIKLASGASSVNVEGPPKDGPQNRTRWIYDPTTGVYAFEYEVTRDAGDWRKINSRGVVQGAVDAQCAYLMSARPASGGGLTINWNSIVVYTGSSDPGPPDTTKPIVNTSFNITNPVIGDTINFTGNFTDETGLLTANWTINLTTGLTFFNYTVSGTSGTVSNKTTLTEAGVFNFTLYVTDTNNNVQQNSTLITVTDNVNPSANITNQNASVTLRFGDRWNISAFLQDETALDFGNFTFNLTGPTNVYNFSFLALSGTTAIISQNITINLTRGNVINATVYVTDTSGNRGTNSTLITIADKLGSIVFSTNGT